MPKHGAPMTMVATISDFGDAAIPHVINKNRTFEKEVFAIQIRFKIHKHIIWSSEKTFIPEVVIDWSEWIFLPGIG
jgi:hypothetical protein